ncbi:MAG: pro-sigmaK processing inhibitor BofA family protein [Oscillospiraceae bacterium]|nr:pro-sigmaK processing inhibitor BofA family protein [Oscillospiraceae bacterium]
MRFLPVLWLLPALPLLLFCSRNGAPIRTGISSAALGLSGLAAACILSPVTGVAVSVNFFTTAVSVLLGLPGVAGIMILTMLS